MFLESLLKKRTKSIFYRLLAYGHLDCVLEVYWSQVYHDTISNSEWLHDKAVSPGRMAVGYNFLYVLYRVLNAVHPVSVLELGLGQSTRVVSQYAAKFKAKHVVVDHDMEWADFFCKDNEKIIGDTNICILPLEICPVRGGSPLQ